MAKDTKMETIEERSWDAAVRRMQGDSIYALGYKDGATEQEAIDEDHLREVKKMLIDKACIAFKHFMVVQYGELIDKSMEMYWKRNITKALEE